MTTTTLIRTEECSESFPKRSENNRMVPAAKKILVVDDQWNTPLFVALQQEGYEVLKRNALREVFDEMESSLNDKWSW